MVLDEDDDDDDCSVCISCCTCSSASTTEVSWVCSTFHDYEVVIHDKKTKQNKLEIIWDIDFVMGFVIITLMLI